MLIFDAHLDLSMNALEWNRDLTRPLDEIRQREQGRTDKPDRGRGTVSLGEMRSGHVGLCVATLIARYVKPANKLPGFHSPEIAWAQTQGQLAWYRAMEAAGQMTQIRDRGQLDRHVKLWENDPPADAPIGYVLSLEGADSILSPAHLEQAYEQGLRAIGPAHYGPGTYAQGTHVTGGIGTRGRELLAEMERLGIILDATHLSDESFWEALDHFGGRVWASHSNCRALVPDQRQFSDEQLQALDRARRGDRRRARRLDDGARLAARQNHTRRSRRHAGAPDRSHRSRLPVGGQRQPQRDRHGSRRRVWPRAVPDRPEHDRRPGARCPRCSSERGYPAADIERIMHGNWIRFLGRSVGVGCAVRDQAGRNACQPCGTTASGSAPGKIGPASWVALVLAEWFSALAE